MIFAVINKILNGGNNTCIDFGNDKLSGAVERTASRQLTVFNECAVVGKNHTLCNFQGCSRGNGKGFAACDNKVLGKLELTALIGIQSSCTKIASINNFANNLVFTSANRSTAANRLIPKFGIANIGIHQICNLAGSDSCIANACLGGNSCSNVAVGSRTKACIRGVAADQLATVVITYNATNVTCRACECHIIGNTVFNRAVVYANDCTENALGDGNASVCHTATRNGCALKDSTCYQTKVNGVVAAIGIVGSTAVKGHFHTIGNRKIFNNRTLGKCAEQTENRTVVCRSQVFRESSNAISLSVKNTSVANGCIIDRRACNGNPFGCAVGCTVGNIADQSCVKIVIACVNHFGKPHQVAKGFDFIESVLCKHGRNPVSANRTVVYVVCAVRRYVAAATATNGAIGFILATGDFKFVSTLGDLTVGISTSLANCSCITGSSAALVVTGIVCIIGVVQYTAVVIVSIYFGAINGRTCIDAKLLTHAEFKCKTTACKLGFGNGEATVLGSVANSIAANCVVLRISAAVAKRVTDNTAHQVFALNGAIVDVVGKRTVVLITGNTAGVCTANINSAVVDVVTQSALIYLTGNTARGRNVTAYGTVVGTVFNQSTRATRNTAKGLAVKRQTGVYRKEFYVTAIGTVSDSTARDITNNTARSCRRSDSGVLVVAVLNQTAKVLTNDCAHVGAGCKIRIFNSYVLNNTARAELGNKTCVAGIGPIIEVIKTGNGVSVTVKGTRIGNKGVNAGFMVHNHTDRNPQSLAGGLAIQAGEVTCIKGNVCDELCIGRTVALPYKIRKPHELTDVADLVVAANQGSCLGVCFILAESAKAVCIEVGVVNRGACAIDFTGAGICPLYKHTAVVIECAVVDQISLYCQRNAIGNGHCVACGNGECIACGHYKIRRKRNIFCLGSCYTTLAGKHFVAAGCAGIIVKGMCYGFCNFGAAHISLVVLELVVFVDGIEEFIGHVTVKNSLFARKNLFTHSAIGVSRKTASFTGSVYLIVRDGNTNVGIILRCQRSHRARCGSRGTNHLEAVRLNTVVIFKIFRGVNHSGKYTHVWCFENLQRCRRVGVFNSAYIGVPPLVQAIDRRHSGYLAAGLVFQNHTAFHTASRNHSAMILRKDSYRSFG